MTQSQGALQGTGSGGPNDLKSMTTRQYLDATVVPILLQAMAEVAKERPPDPVDYIVKFLRTHNPETTGA